MAIEIKITVHQADLGHANPEFGIYKDDLTLYDGEGAISIKVFVDGQVADLTEETEKSIIATVRPNGDKNLLPVVVTTRYEKIINVLEYDLKQKKLRKHGGQPKDDEQTLVKVIEKAADKIVAAIHSKKGAGRAPSQAGTK
jgi:hypothetical protein